MIIDTTPAWHCTDCGHDHIASGNICIGCTCPRICPVGTDAPDPVLDNFNALPINDTRTPEQKERWAQSLADIADGRYERPPASRRRVAIERLADVLAMAMREPLRKEHRDVAEAALDGWGAKFVDDPQAFWRALIKTPEGRAAALKLREAMPSFATEWRDVHYTGRVFERRDRDDDTRWIAAVWLSRDQDRWLWRLHKGVATPAESLTAAKAAADRALVAAGWVLVDEPAGGEG